MRYMFSLRLEFEFSIQIFILAMEEDAFDIAVLLYKEFNYMMREINEKE